ncbi:uncharacterized protein [Anabrus simplex]|uniref:uncharacterized protein n=1 Tax=Anabrus simplex TaxID=316456 RepID=UPI0035A3A515
MNPGPDMSWEDWERIKGMIGEAIKSSTGEILVNELKKEQAKGFEDMKSWFKDQWGATEKRLEENERVTRVLKEQVKDLEKEVTFLKNELGIVNQQRMKKCIYIYGLQEERNEDRVQLIYKVVDLVQNKLKLNFSEVDMDDIERVGKVKGRRPVKVKMMSTIMADIVLRNAKNLQGERIWISKDLGKEGSENIKILRKHLGRAKHQGLKAFIKDQRLVVTNGVWWRVWSVAKLKKMEEGLKQEEERSKRPRESRECAQEEGGNVVNMAEATRQEISTVQDSGWPLHVDWSSAHVGDRSVD